MKSNSIKEAPPKRLTYCICQSTGDGFMIGCDACNGWFHGKCVGVTKKFSNSIENYYCDECRKKDPSLELKPKIEPAPVEKKTVTFKQEPLEERKQEKKIHEKIKLKTTPSKPRVKNTTPQPKSSPNKRKVSQRAKLKGHDRKQCGNPNCIFESRSTSKYCSDDCGVEFNKLRYEHFFERKWRLLEENHSQARLKKMQDLHQLEKEKLDVEQLIKNLKDEKEEIELYIKNIKHEAGVSSKAMQLNSKDNDDDDIDDNDDAEEPTTGELSKTFCISCGMSHPNSQLFKHWFTCYKKQEAAYHYTADVKANFTSKEDENPKLYCHVQDKKTKRYCMHIAAACPQHSNWNSDKDEVCGCPLKIMQKLYPDGDYCLELKKNCKLHYHWDKFRLAQNNLQRVQAFNRLEVINDRIRASAANLGDTYGGVVGVMLHNTLNHQTVN